MASSKGTVPRLLDELPQARPQAEPLPQRAGDEDEAPRPASVRRNGRERLDDIPSTSACCSGRTATPTRRLLPRAEAQGPRRHAVLMEARAPAGRRPGGRSSPPASIGPPLKRGKAPKSIAITASHPT
jgi:hypothetical protein